MRGTNHFPGVWGEILKRHCRWKGACTPKPSKGGLALCLIPQAVSWTAREVGGGEAAGPKEFSSSSCHVKRTPNQGAGARGSTTPARARAPSLQAGAGGPVAQGRAGKEGAGHKGESIKGVIQPVLSSEAPRARPGRLEKKVAPGRGRDKLP